MASHADGRWVCVVYDGHRIVKGVQDQAFLMVLEQTLTNQLNSMHCT